MGFLFGTTWGTLAETSSFVIPLRRPKLGTLHPNPLKLDRGDAGDSIREFGGLWNVPKRHY